MIDKSCPYQSFDKGTRIPVCIKRESVPWKLKKYLPNLHRCHCEPVGRTGVRLR